MTALTDRFGRAVPLFVLLLGVMFPLVQLVKTVFDRATTVRDLTGTVHFTSDGRAAQLLQLGFAVTSAAVALHLLVRSLRMRRFHMTSWALLALVVLVAETLRGRAEPTSLVYAGLTVLVFLGAGVMRLNRRSLHTVGLVVSGTAFSNLIFALINTERGWGACRAGKCTVAGGLLRGYFPQENVLGVFLASLLPAVAYLRHPLMRRASLAMVVLSILLTGSRTALTATVLGLWAYAVIRRRSCPERAHGDAAKVVTLFPLTAFLASAVLVFTLPDMALTGRGLIFRIVREAWVHEPLLGPGREVLYDAYYSSMANWFLAHEHGQASYILGSAGLVGMALMVWALACIIRAGWVSDGPLPVVFALVPALGFLTEPTWEVSVRAPYLMSFLLTVALSAQALRLEPLPVPATPAMSAPPVAPDGGSAVGGECRAAACDTVSAPASP